MRAEWKLLLALQLILAVPSLGLPKICEAGFKALSHHGRVESRLNRQVKKLEDSEGQKLTNIIDALHFVDYATAAPELLKVFLGKKSLERTRFAGAYDRYLFNFFGWVRIGRRQSALDNYRTARKSLQSSKKPLEIDVLADLHSALHEGRVNGVRESHRGEYRGTEHQSNLGELTSGQIKELSKNPYLRVSLKEDGTTTVHHASVRSISKEALKRIRKSHPNLVKEVEAFQKSGTEARAPPELQQRLVKALVEERVGDFNAKVQALGALKTVAKKSQYTNLVGDLVRDILAIAPFPKGSERVAKTLMDGLLAKGKLPVPFLADIFDALRLPPETWQQHVLEGMNATQAVKAHIADRLAAEEPLGGAVELLTPLLPQHIWVTKKVEGLPKKTDAQAKVEAVDKEQFTTYLQTRFREDPELRKRFGEEPGAVAAELYNGFKEFIQPRRVDYTKRKHNPGKESLVVRLIPEEFSTQMGDPTLEPKAWGEKIDRHFLPEITWRGRAYKSHRLSDAEILELFTDVSHHGVSIKLGKYSGTYGGLRSAVGREHERFNEALVNGDLPYWATHHSETGPMYNESFGISTSKKRLVSKGFAMGAMFGVDYGKQNDPEFQKTLRDRLSIGAYRSIYGVDLGRLKQVEPTFSYKYFRQVEVMEAGAIDPDAVMVVHRWSPEGKVLTTFARNPKKPSEVWVVEGDFDPMKGRAPAKKVLIRTESLSE